MRIGINFLRSNSVDDASSAVVIFGAHNIRDASEPNQVRVTVPSSGFRIHADYNRQLIRNDIAMIRLATPVTLNQFIQPVTLPIDASDLFANQ